MKKTLNSILLVLLALLMLTLAACGTSKEDNSQIEQPKTSDGSQSTSPVEKTGLWENATYLTDKTFGEGATALAVEVSVEGQSVTFTVNTDKSTVGEALLEHNLIDGEEGLYGLYIKKVNGITADFDVDQSYWSFYINGEYAMTGVDATEISEGVAYKLEYTK